MEGYAGVDPLASWFENWMASGEGWKLIALVGVAALSIVFNLALFRRRKRVTRVEGVGLGRVMALLGGSVLVAGSFVPFILSSAGGFFGFILTACGIMWLSFFSIPKQASAIWGFIWGTALLLLTAPALVFARGMDVLFGLSLFMILLGSVALIVGSVLEFRSANRKRTPVPMSTADGSTTQAFGLRPGNP